MASESIKGKIVYSLSLLMMLFIVLSYISYSQLERTEKIRKTDEKIEGILLQNLRLFKNDTDFFDYDLNEEVFFKAGESKYLKNHDSIVSSIRELIKSVEEEESIGIDPALWHIDSILVAYDQVFKSLVDKLKLRGYKGYGLEGELRDLAHEIEDKKALNTIDLLVLRKYEKNYLIRFDEEYAKKFQVKAEELSKKLKPKSEASELFNEYKARFSDLVLLSKEVGKHKKTGLKEILNNKTAELLLALDNLSKDAEEQTTATHQLGMNIFMACAVVAVIFCFALIIFIGKNLN